MHNVSICNSILFHVKSVKTFQFSSFFFKNVFLKINVLSESIKDVKLCKLEKNAEEEQEYKDQFELALKKERI